MGGGWMVVRVNSCRVASSDQGGWRECTRVEPTVHFLVSPLHSTVLYTNYICLEELLNNQLVVTELPWVSWHTVFNLSEFHRIVCELSFCPGFFCFWTSLLGMRLQVRWFEESEKVSRPSLACAAILSQMSETIWEDLNSKLFPGEHAPRPP